jgi:ATP-binding cassette subfamily F protein 2
MAPSASKQKRLAEKAAKKSAGISGGDASTSTSTPSGSVNGGSVISTPITSMSAANSTEDLMSMAKLNIATDRYVYRDLSPISLVYSSA